MRTIQFLAVNAGLEELIDLASFPNLVQIGAILTVLALVALAVLASMLRGVKGLRTEVAEALVHTSPPAGLPSGSLAPPPTPLPAGPPALAAAQTGGPAQGQAGPGLPALQGGPPGAPQPVPVGSPVQTGPLPGTPPMMAPLPADPGVGRPLSFAAVIAEPPSGPLGPPAAPQPVLPARPQPSQTFTVGGQTPERPVPPGPQPPPPARRSISSPAAPEVPQTPPARTPAPMADDAVPLAINTAARREISLVGRALKILDELEQSETDPDKLFALFALDNLMARMRRGSETQMILAGRDPERAIRDALSVSDVVRTGSSQIEHYERVRIALDWDPMIRSYAVVPLAHLVAELLENATSFSPEGTAVEIGASNHRGDVVLTIEDSGVGMSPQELATVNKIVKDGPSPDDLSHGRLGVAVVARLAARLGAAVSFAPGQGDDKRGTTAVIRIPAKLVDDRPVDATRLPESGTAPALPPQPALEPSAMTAAPPTAETFQPVQLSQQGRTELPKRGEKPTGADAPGARPQTGPMPTVPPAHVPAVPPARVPAVPPAHVPAASAAAGTIPPAATPAAAGERPAGIVPLGARFSPLGEGANPSAALPRHSADGQALAERQPVGAHQGAGAPPGSQFPFAGAPAGPAQPAGHEPRPAGRAGGPALPGTDLPAFADVIAPAERPLSPDMPVRRRPTAARRSAAQSPAPGDGRAPEPFPPLPGSPGSLPPSMTAPPGLIPPIEAPVPPRRRSMQGPLPGAGQPGQPGGPDQPGLMPPGTIHAGQMPPGPVPAGQMAPFPVQTAVAPSDPGTLAPPVGPPPSGPGGLPQRGGTGGFMPPPGTGAPLAAGAAGPPGTIPPPPGAGLARRAGGSPPSAVQAGGLAGPAQTGGFRPGGTMQPGGGNSALSIPDLSGSIAGSAIALKASIQEEALAELAGLNAYKPEKTESRPASGLARRQAGASSVPAIAEPVTSPPKARDADKIRSALSAFQLGTRRGRNGSRSGSGKG